MKMVLVERLELPLLLRVKQVPLPLGDTRVAVRAGIGPAMLLRQRSMIPLQQRTKMVGPPGFEPRQTSPKLAVRPDNTSDRWMQG